MHKAGRLSEVLSLPKVLQFRRLCAVEGALGLYCCLVGVVACVRV